MTIATNPTATVTLPAPDGFWVEEAAALPVPVGVLPPATTDVSPPDEPDEPEPDEPLLGVAVAVAALPPKSPEVAVLPPPRSVPKRLPFLQPSSNWLSSLATEGSAELMQDEHCNQPSLQKRYPRNNLFVDFAHTVLLGSEIGFCGCVAVDAVFKGREPTA